MDLWGLTLTPALLPQERSLCSKRGKRRLAGRPWRVTAPHQTTSHPKGLGTHVDKRTACSLTRGREGTLVL